MNKISLIFILSLFTFSASAEDMQLTADNRVEWHHKDQKIVAIGNAIASRGDMQVKADKMSADYKKNPQTGKNQITKVHARGNVKMKSDRADAYGNTLDYSLEQDTIILKGEPAKIQTSTETITAKDNITYHPSSKKAIALGKVEASNGKDKIFGDKMIAYFEQTSQSSDNLEMKQVEIFGNVKIINAGTTVWAEQGLYQPKNGLVELYKNVIIEQNGNLLKGDYAQSNLKTGISKLLAGKSSKQRVSGVFKEKSNKNTSTPKTTESK